MPKDFDILYVIVFEYFILLQRISEGKNAYERQNYKKHTVMLLYRLALLCCMDWIYV